MGNTLKTTLLKQIGIVDCNEHLILNELMPSSVQGEKLQKHTL